MAPQNEQQTDSFFLPLLLAAAAVQLLAIAFTPYGLSPDEAHYWEWSRRLDWSFYSKGPLIALIIKAGTAVAGVSAFGVRMPAALLMLLTMAVLWKTLRLVAPRPIAFSLWAAGLSMVIILQSGLVMTTDAPCAVCWISAIYAALRAEENPKWWLLFGAAVGLGFLAKFTTVILFAGIVLYLVISGRSHLRRPWIYLAGAITAIFFIPVIIWNARHGWINFAHNAQHVVKSGTEVKLNPQYFLELLGGQLGLAGPLLFCSLIAAICCGGLSWRRGDRLAGLLFCTTAPLLALCVAVSFSKSVYANWPLPIYLGALPLAARLWATGQIPSFVPRLNRAAAGLNLLIVIPAYFLFFGATAGIPGHYLPTKKLAGWQQLGAAVDNLFEKEAFAAVVTDEYGTASEIAFYSSRHPQTFCAVLGNRRMNQYDVWGGWEKLKDQRLLIVLRKPEVPQDLSRRFASIKPVGPSGGLPIAFAGEILHSYYFFSADSYDGSTPPLPSRR